MFKARTLVGLLAAAVFVLLSATAGAQSTQCTSTAVAGGTADAITIPVLPCSVTTTLLILTMQAANSTTTPTIAMPPETTAKVVVKGAIAPLAIGDFAGAGFKALLTYNGTNWTLLNPASFSGGVGDVVGPGSSVNGDVVVFNGTSGKLIKDSGTPLSGLAPLANPLLTGVPRAPTATVGTNTTQLATTAFVTAAIIPANPGNFYISTTGNDSNNCLTGGTPCATIQHVLSLFPLYNIGNGAVTVNLAAGTYNQGTLFSGLGSNHVVNIVGTSGSGSTSIALTSCGGVKWPIQVGANSYVSLSGVTISSNCAGNGNIFLERYSKVDILTDVVLGASTSYQIAATEHSSVHIVNNFTISGNATYGFSASGGSSFAIENITVTFSGPPTIGTVFNLIDGSFLNYGTSTVFTGVPIGTAFVLANDSYVDNEQNTSYPQTPGSLSGQLGSGSFYYRDPGVTCVGAATGCNGSVTPPTGLGAISGAHGKATIASGSSAKAGDVVLDFGVGAATAGTVNIGLSAIPIGPIASGGFCLAGLANMHGNTWVSGASVRATFIQGANELILVWDNSLTAPANTAVYDIVWKCE